MPTKNYKVTKFDGQRFNVFHAVSSEGFMNVCSLSYTLQIMTETIIKPCYYPLCVQRMGCKPIDTQLQPPKQNRRSNQSKSL